MAKPRGRQAHPGGALQGVTPDERAAIKARRLELGWHQKDVARKAGTSTATISNLESGRSGQTRRSVYLKARLVLFGPEGSNVDAHSDTYKKILDGAMELDETKRQAVLALVEALRTKREPK